MKYLNPLLSPEERAQDLLVRMSPEEKIGQMIQISFDRVTEEEAERWVVERFAGSFLHVLGEKAAHLQVLSRETPHGIPVLFGIDAVHGHVLNNNATIFPSQLSMSCSWDEDLIRQAGRVTAKEVAADGLHWTFSPVLCVGRDLRWGRIDETFGEDPYLIGVLAKAMVKGYQGDELSSKDSILACAKHYIAYGESTGGRDSYDAGISMRTVTDVFLPPFAAAVEAGCATFMAGYQSIDGTPVSAHKRFLRDILKDELDFPGFVVTDWNNVGNLISYQGVCGDWECAVKTAIEAGNDMIMHTPAFYESALNLVKNGVLSETLIDDAVLRILTAKFAFGLFDEKRQPDLEAGKGVFNCKSHQRINLQMARDSIVLLKNDDILPLDKGITTIAVIGPNADDIQAQFGDWTFFSHPDPKPNAIPVQPCYTMLDGIRTLAEKRDIQVKYAKGCDIMDPEDQDISGAMAIVADAAIIITVIGDCLKQNGEGRDRANLDLSGAQQELLEALRDTGKPLVVVLVNGKPLSIPWVAEYADAVLETFNSGAMGGLAAAEILFGEVNPSGKLSISFPYHTGQLPVYYNQMPGWHVDRYIDMPAEPLYSFGYGLSFTSFYYDNLRLSLDTCTPGDTITVSVDISNTGKRDGMEIVQFYVNDVVSSVVTPVKKLIGFRKVRIATGWTERVDLSLHISDLGLVTPDGQYMVESGEFIIMAGPSSREEDLLKSPLTVI